MLREAFKTTQHVEYRNRALVPQKNNQPNLVEMFSKKVVREQDECIGFFPREEIHQDILDRNIITHVNERLQRKTRLDQERQEIVWACGVLSIERVA